MLLEAIRERSQGWLAKLILVLITVPFALWGVESYIRGGGDADVVASVDGYKISQQDFTRALKEQQEKLRRALGRNYDPSLLDTPEMRRSILDGLIGERLFLAEAVRSGIQVNDARLAAMIAEEPAFQQDGKFSQERYERLLKQQNLTPVGFEARLRQDLMLQELRDGYAKSAFVPRTLVENAARIGEQKREVSQVALSPDQYMSQVKVEPAAIQAYYENHRGDFSIPEQVRVEYVTLSPDSVLGQEAVSDAEVKKYYDEHAARYQDPGERQAGHILIAVTPNAPEAERAAARAKAEKLYQELQKNPAAFADMARKESQDPGSAQQGGDLGFFAPGGMVKPFSDAVFHMKVGEIVGPVETEFGYHIIKLTAVKPGKTTSLDAAKDEITQELRKERAATKFAELAETFSNLVYEQSDSLKPAADAVKLTIQSSPWISKQGHEVPLLSNDKLLQAIFAEDAIKNRRNTEAIEVAPSTLVSARVVDYKPSSTKPLDAVAGEIGEKLKREQAAVLAMQDGKARLAKLQQGEALNLAWSAPQLVGRKDAQGVSSAVLSGIYKADVRKLPAFVGVENPQGGFSLVRISRVEEAKPNPEKGAEYAQNLQQLFAQESVSAYLAYLKQKASIKVMSANLEKKDQ
jgi:peptidyl-prolyl cis-trans isomerase D